MSTISSAMRSASSIAWSNGIRFSPRLASSRRSRSSACCVRVRSHICHRPPAEERCALRFRFEGTFSAVVAVFDFLLAFTFTF
jgi:hypothetical protein